MTRRTGTARLCPLESLLPLLGRPTALSLHPAAPPASRASRAMKPFPTGLPHQGSDEGISVPRWSSGAQASRHGRRLDPPPLKLQAGRPWRGETPVLEGALGQARLLLHESRQRVRLGRRGAEAVSSATRPGSADARMPRSRRATAHQPRLPATARPDPQPPGRWPARGSRGRPRGRRSQPRSCWPS